MKTTSNPSEISLNKETFNQLQDFIQDWLSKTDYKVTGNISDLSSLFESETINQKYSGNRMKQLKKRIYIFSKKQTIKQLNNLLNVFKINSIKVDRSDKESQIISKKSQMKLYKAQYEKALAEYKLEKANYYKKTTV